MTRTYTPDPDAFTVHANGLDFACLSWGEGPLILLVHGFPDTARTWDALGPRLAEAGYRAVAPFTRGIAPTEIPADGKYDNDTLANDMAAVIEALGEESAIVIGHDFGASASYGVAGLHPDKVSKLITVAIPHPATMKPTLSLLWGARHFLTHQLPGAPGRFAANDYAHIRMFYERWSPGFDWSDTEFEAAKNSYSAPGATTAALAYYKALTVKPLPSLRAKIAAPTLILGGKTDGVATQAHFEGSTRRFTGTCEVKMLPGGHFLHREHPEPFIEAVLDFLRQ